MGTLRWIYDATVISPLALVSFRWFSLCSCNTGAGSHHSAPSLVKMCFYCWFIFKNKIFDLSTEVKKSASCSSNFNPTWRLKAGGEGDDRGQDGWMASPTQWTWVWASSGSWVMDKEAWRAAVHEVTKSRIWLNDWTRTIYCSYNLQLPKHFWK